MEDARRREEADRVREDGRKRFAQEIRDRVEGLRDAVRSVKGELLAKGTPKPRTLFYLYSIVFIDSVFIDFVRRVDKCVCDNQAYGECSRPSR